MCQHLRWSLITIVLWCYTLLTRRTSQQTTHTLFVAGAFRRQMRRVMCQHLRWSLTTAIPCVALSPAPNMLGWTPSPPCHTHPPTTRATGNTSLPFFLPAFVWSCMVVISHHCLHSCDDGHLSALPTCTTVVRSVYLPALATAHCHPHCLPALLPASHPCLSCPHSSFRLPLLPVLVS